MTADRVPGVSQRFSALLGIISEGFEDAHYFIGDDHHHENHGSEHIAEDPQEPLLHHCHEHDNDSIGSDASHHNETGHHASLLEERLNQEHKHNHDLDLPTRLLKFAFSPVYFLAAVWDFSSSRLNEEPREVLAWTRAWNKQQGVPKEETIFLDKNKSSKYSYLIV